MAKAAESEVVLDPKRDRLVITASSLGTVFEWYDFFVYGILAALIGKLFFPADNPTAATLASLAIFGAGFGVRPFGAILFGYFGDKIGRKYTFLVTITLMGVATAAIGLLPTFETAGIWAAALLLLMRCLQGLALGGEYGGAAIYVAEHAPQGKRGQYTSWIQASVAGGFLLAVIVVLITRQSMSTEAFEAWGWRVPFLLSVVLLGISVWIRMQLSESPTFKRMKEEGKGSKSPLLDSFGNKRNLKLVLLALLGLTAGQAVVWYTGQFYSLFYLTQTLKVEANTANIMIAVALLAATPFFVIFGSLSDKIGRKPIIMLGCLLAVLTYFPVFEQLTKAANPDLHAAQQANKVVVIADPAECSFQFNPTGTVKFTSSCDIAKQKLAASSVSYSNEIAAPGTPALIKVGDVEIKTTVTPEDVAAAKEAAEQKLTALKAEAPVNAKAVKTAEDALKNLSDEKKSKDAVISANLSAALKAAGYPAKADPAKVNNVYVIAILTYLVILVTMVYGPIAAMLVEMFPTRIRYTSMSLPYHIGNGWFGGLLPTTAFAIVAQTGNMYNGLWYPIIIAGATFIIGTLFIKETKDVDIYADD